MKFKKKKKTFTQIMFNCFRFAGKRAIQFVENNSKQSNDASKNANKSYFVKKSLSTTLGNGQFQFNFPINEIENLKIEKSDDAHDAYTNGVSTHSKNESTNLNLHPNPNRMENTSIDQYKTSDNSFRFNFSIQ